MARPHGGLGLALLELNRTVEAIACLKQALQLRPGDAEILNNLGNAHNARSELDDAIVCYQEALQSRPGWSLPCYNLGIAFKTQGRMAEARSCFEETLRINPEDQIAQSSYVGCLHYDPDITPAQLLAEHQRWAKRHTQGLESVARHANTSDPQRRLRVGYVSADFRSHAVAFFLEPILAHYDPRQVETFCYSGVAAPDEVTARLRGLAQHWVETLGLSDEELATRIRADGIDLLVDLVGHTGGNRLRVFARKPAPVQLIYLGYPGTTGLSTIDYRLTDAVADPPEETSWHTEELLHLPGVFCCYAPPGNIPQEIRLPSDRQGGVTFGSLHKLEKLNGAVLDLWVRIVQEVPGSRLLSCRDALRGTTATYWLEQFLQRGLAREQIVLQWLEPVGMQHLRVYDQIDIALDAFPWNGHTTACEALWMGVPVVTLRGQRHAGRMVASLLSCLGLTELLAETPEEYARIAVRLANDPQQRGKWRAGLRERMQQSPLCDAANFTRGLEAAYRRVWQNWCHQQPDS
jgi:protein O-GlcNAc transferase